MSGSEGFIRDAVFPLGMSRNQSSIRRKTKKSQAFAIIFTALAKDILYEGEKSNKKVSKVVGTPPYILVLLCAGQIVLPPSPGKLRGQMKQDKYTMDPG